MLAGVLADGQPRAGQTNPPWTPQAIDRFPDKPRLDESEIFLSWYRLALHFSADVTQAPNLLPVLLDATYFEPFAALIASVPRGGRWLPIAFTDYHRRQPRACFPPIAVLAVWEGWPARTMVFGRQSDRCDSAGWASNSGI